MTRQEQAIENFKKGYNCTQSVVLAFKDLLNIDEETLLRLSSPFGGGMGRMRMTCGAFSGINIVLGLLYGYNTPETGEIKMELYKKVQELGKKFTEENGSLMCSTLLNIDTKELSYVPTPRTEEFYKKRPCPMIIGNSAKILDDFIKKTQQ